MKRQRIKFERLAPLNIYTSLLKFVNLNYLGQATDLITDQFHPMFFSIC